MKSLGATQTNTLAFSRRAKPDVVQRSSHEHSKDSHESAHKGAKGIRARGSHEPVRRQAKRDRAPEPYGSAGQAAAIQKLLGAFQQEKRAELQPENQRQIPDRGARAEVFRCIAKPVAFRSRLAAPHLDATHGGDTQRED